MNIDLKQWYDALEMHGKVRETFQIYSTNISIGWFMGGT